jgi:hypothetical protein
MQIVIQLGAASPISDSCNQRAANNVNNGVPRNRGAVAPSTGTLTVNKVCNPNCMGDVFSIIVDDNGNIHFISLVGGDSQSLELSPGLFAVAEVPKSGFTSSSSGDCSGTISAGQHLTCTITNSR